SGFCADGFCCNTACNGPCDVCNATQGTCTYAAKGSAGAPACGLYACTGGSASCSATCGSTQPCGPGITCVGSTCVPKLASLTDDFEASAMDPVKWRAFSEISG